MWQAQIAFAMSVTSYMTELTAIVAAIAACPDTLRVSQCTEDNSGWQAVEETGRGYPSTSSLSLAAENGCRLWLAAKRVPPGGRYLLWIKAWDTPIETIFSSQLNSRWMTRWDSYLHVN